MFLWDNFLSNYKLKNNTNKNDNIEVMFVSFHLVLKINRRDDCKKFAKTEEGEVK